MKMRWVTLLMIVAMLSCSVVFGQKEASVRWAAPIVATLDGFDTGITVVNLSGAALTVKNFEFYSISGTEAVGAEAASMDSINRSLTAVSYSVPANGRLSILASEILGLGVNGHLRFSVLGTSAARGVSELSFPTPVGDDNIDHAVYEAIFDPDFSTDSIEGVEITRREKSPK